MGSPLPESPFRSERNKMDEEVILKLAKVKGRWETIKTLPFERNRVRFDILVMSPENWTAKNPEMCVFIFDENSFRKQSFDIYQNAVFKDGLLFGQLIDILTPEELEKGLEKPQWRAK